MKPFLFSCFMLLLLSVCCRAQPFATPRGMALPMVNIEAEEYSKTGARVPNLSITDVSGNSWLLNELRGKVVFIYCFAADSVSSKAAVASINDLADKFADSAAVFLAVTPDALSAMEQCGGNTALKCPIAYRHGKTLNELGVTTLPAVIIVNKKGRIALWNDAIHTGGPEEQEAMLSRLLRK